jgi:cold shock CspA family protein
LVPDLLFSERGPTQRLRGILHAVNEEKGYGFLTAQTDLGLDTIREDIFLHITDLRMARGGVVSNADFAQLRMRGVIIEFEVEDDGDRKKAVNAVEFRPELL